MLGLGTSPVRPRSLLQRPHDRFIDTTYQQVSHDVLQRFQWMDDINDITAHSRPEISPVTSKAGVRTHRGATTATTYDAGDRPTQITDSVGSTITRTYENGARRFSGGSCSAGT
jgi:YD repeat-containing protein